MNGFVIAPPGPLIRGDLDDARALWGLGLFVRSLVGLERDAAKAAFAGFLAGRNLNANQIEFVNLIIEHLTERGAMDPPRLYESPFTDFDDQGVSGLFPNADVQRIVQRLNEVSGRAAARGIWAQPGGDGDVKS